SLGRHHHRSCHASFGSREIAAAGACAPAQRGGVMYRVLQVLNDAEVEECRRIAASAPFVDGRITNPHNSAKQNEQLHDASAYQKSSELLRNAMLRSAEFIEFAFPVSLAPPMMTRYKPGMKYGAHADAAFIQLPGATIRSDLSCTIFLNEPKD